MRRSPTLVLAAKDVGVLRRSPLLVALLIVYPLVVALLLGIALSRGPSEPKIALVLPPDARSQTIDTGQGQALDVESYADTLVKDTRPVRAASRAEAAKLVRDGDVTGALVLPPDTLQKLRSVLSLEGNPRLPTLEVITNDADPVRARALRQLITARLADANATIGRQLVGVAGGALDILLDGGSLALLGTSGNILGLRAASQLLQRSAGEARTPQARRDLEAVKRFADLAVENLRFAAPILRSVSNPIRVKRTSTTGPAVSIEVFAAAAAAAVSLLLVAVLLGAGLVALEREEGTLGRLVRAAVPPRALLGSKVLAAGALAAGVGLIAIAVVAPFVDLEASRAPLWVLAAVLSGAACAALGVALGCVAREVRTASLLAVLLLIPVVVIGLVPDGTLGGVAGAAADVVSGAFPFRPSLRLVTGAVEHGDLLAPALHLVALVAAWAVVARVALSRTA